MSKKKARNTKTIKPAAGQVACKHTFATWNKFKKSQVNSTWNTK